ncbi:FAD-dependent oxidoreductase [Bradyrhizobium guangzhouense]|uniref:FAD-dependent oxidoreductase n=1 Tax=Bradyrhizobium guangzhouense TaxID=1325095 RepID=UPI001009D8FC|nr:FAD-dependent oxidoreductase [Bradyrhizobium guangzhouense]RXH19845.1 FAD-binding oxidoreductase [Bradyrhizobium guangzhouense]
MIDALVIGGGAYGCDIAAELKSIGFERVVLAEREVCLFGRASYANQARIHNGYHYPRSITTAERSRINFERFVQDYPEAVLSRMVKLYAIAKDSRISAHQFAVFCERIGAPYHAAPPRFENLFDPALIDAVFVTAELAFDATVLARHMQERLRQLKVDVRLGTEARIVGGDSAGASYELNGQRGRARWLFNCTYSDIGRIGIGIETRIKRELAELALVRPPSALDGLGITVLDGPFFSLMPFPALGMYSLSHVRYTPHQASLDPTERLAPVIANASYMLRDTARFVPSMSSCRYETSLFEIKATIARNEDDDGRPILFERNKEHPRIFSILGAKIDNIYDTRAYLRSLHWSD